jgi:hypothetical protein
MVKRPAARKGCGAFFCFNIFNFQGGWGGKGPGNLFIRLSVNKLWTYLEGGPWVVSRLLSAIYKSLCKSLEINAVFLIYKELKM